MIKKLLITGVEPDAMESPRTIRTAYLNIKTKKGDIEAFVSDWDSLGLEGMNLEELNKLLVGKKINAELHLFISKIEFKKDSKSSKDIAQPSQEKTQIVGEVIKIKGPFTHKFIENGKTTLYKYFNLDLDCGIGVVSIQISSSKFEENNVKVGDYIEAVGRLDVYIEEDLKK